jgi:hypothetical protein
VLSRKHAETPQQPSATNLLLRLLDFEWFCLLYAGLMLDNTSEVWFMHTTDCKRVPRSAQGGQQLAKTIPNQWEVAHTGCRACPQLRSRHIKTHSHCSSHWFCTTHFFQFNSPILGAGPCRKIIPVSVAPIRHQYCLTFQKGRVCNCNVVKPIIWQ